MLLIDLLEDFVGWVLSIRPARFGSICFVTAWYEPEQINFSHGKVYGGKRYQDRNPGTRGTA
jgi:hypothetical protein